MKLNGHAVLLGFLMALAAAPALAESPVRALPSPGAFSMTPFVETDVSVGGKFIEKTSQNFSGAGTALGQAFDAAMTFSVKEQKFSDVYGQPISGGVSFNYGLSHRQELFGRLTYSHASGRAFDAGSVDAAINWGGQAIAANSSLRAKPSDYRDIALDGGYRHYLRVKDVPGLRPFLSGSVGVRYVDSITADITYQGSPLVRDMRFYDTSIAWRAGLGLGFRWDVSPGIAAGFETGIRYNSGLKDDDKTLGSGALGKANNAGERLVIPVAAGMTVAF